MARLTTALLMLIGLLLMSHLPKYTIAQLKPMCISQFALANHACALLPAIESLTDRNNTRIPATADNDDDDGNDDDDAEPERDHHHRRGNGNHGHRRRHENGNGRRQRLRNGSGHRHGHGHGHEHGHEHRGGMRAERDCCRWLDDIDEGCVCTVLLHLPPFLIKPKHEYRVKVGDSCVRSFKCGGI